MSNLVRLVGRTVGRRSSRSGSRAALAIVTRRAARLRHRAEGLVVASGGTLISSGRAAAMLREPGAKEAGRAEPRRSPAS